MRTVLKENSWMAQYFPKLYALEGQETSRRQRLLPRQMEHRPASRLCKSVSVLHCRELHQNKVTFAESEIHEASGKNPLSFDSESDRITAYTNPQIM